MKTIVVKWKESEYGKSMHVIASNHERFKEGTRFDFGYAKLASDQGHTIITLPASASEFTTLFWKTLINAA